MRKTIGHKISLPIIMNFVFSFVLIAHVAFIGYGIKYPNHPSSRMYTKALQELDEFPVSFQLCVKEQIDSQNRYIKLGYDNIWSFYKGITNFYGDWVGWAGHENNSSLSSVKGTRFFINDSLGVHGACFNIILLQTYFLKFLLIGQVLLNQLMTPLQITRKGK